jgi:hypothetical protein
MRHYLTLEKGGYRFVCSMPSNSAEVCAFEVEVFRGESRVKSFTVPMSRPPAASGVDMADTIKLQWAIDRFVDRGTSRRTDRRVRS